MNATSTSLHTLLQYCPSLHKLHPEQNKRYHHNDIGDGNLFADYYRNIARYVPEKRKWYVYTGKVWTPDVGNLIIMELCKILESELISHASQIQEEDLRNQYLKHLVSWSYRRRRETILKDAASVWPIAVADFDSNPYLLNCQNMTLNLKTGETHLHRPEDFLTILTGVNYDPAAKCERWTRFIEEVMQGDIEKATYFQKALGYSLTGDTSRECFFLLYGPSTRNGKGTAMETILSMMGDYGKTCRPDTIMRKPNTGGSGASEDIARLNGARFCNISEPDKGLVLDTALIKTLTGGDTLTSRFLYENSIEFKPQFKIFINTNYFPVVSDVTLFTSGRIKVIPFLRHFEPWERDENLKAELAQPKNLSGVLNWCLEGWYKLQETGFNEPTSVLEAVTDYRQQSDKMAIFVDEVLTKDPAAEESSAIIYQQYDIWCAAHSFIPESRKAVNDYFRSIATVKRCRPKSGGEKTTMIIGYRITSSSF